MNTSKIVSLLQQRIMSAIECESAVDNCRTLLKTKGVVSVIGTGSSYATARFVSQALTEQDKLYSVAMHPFEYISAPAYPLDWLIVISYSGSTTDCRMAIQHAKKTGAKRIALVTHAQRPALAECLEAKNGDLVISYGNFSEAEKGFLFFAGTVSPCALFLSASSHGSFVQKLFETLPRRSIEAFTESVSERQLVELFGSYYAMPAMIDLESKFIVGGLAGVNMHESKDFSHGRFMYSLQHGETVPKILLHTSPLTNYERKLKEVLLKTTQRTRCPFLCIRSPYKGLIGSFDLLVQVQYLARDIAKKIGRDIANPDKVPIDGLRLSDYCSL